MPDKRVHTQDAQQGSCCGAKQMTQVSSDRFSVSYSKHHLELIGIGGLRERLHDARMVLCCQGWLLSGLGGIFELYTGQSRYKGTLRKLCFEVKFLLKNYNESEGGFISFSIKLASFSGFFCSEEMYDQELELRLTSVHLPGVFMKCCKYTQFRHQAVCVGWNIL